MLAGDSDIEYIPPARMGCCDGCVGEAAETRRYRPRRRPRWLIHGQLGAESTAMAAARLTGQDVAQAVGQIQRSLNGLVTGQKILDAMRAALPLARKLVGSGASGADFNAVVQLERSLRDRDVPNPSGGPALQIVPNLTYGDNNRTKLSARNVITKAVAASAGSLGVSAVKAQAIKEAIADLTKPDKYMDVIKKYAIYIGLALVAVNVVPGLVARAARGR